MKGAVVSFSVARVCARIDVGDKRKNTGANNEPQEHVKNVTESESTSRDSLGVVL